MAEPRNYRTGDDENQEEVEKLLPKLRALGVAITLDDFGTGHSSLGYLIYFLINYSKIDRSFVSRNPNDANDVNIAKKL